MGTVQEGLKYNSFSFYEVRTAHKCKNLSVLRYIMAGHDTNIVFTSKCIYVLRFQQYCSFAKILPFITDMFADQSG